MPHQRPRLITELFFKRAKLWPVIGIVGVRQSGKSVLLRDIFMSKLKTASYVSLDSKTHRDRAKASPESFTSISDKKTVIIDEIQKAPDLFDAIKLHVDENRRPGMYIISGSTEFSKMTGIRESLTGRAGIMHLYPMVLDELHEKSFGEYWLKKKIATASLSLVQWDKKLKHGGMPGFCFLRSDAEYQAACQAWLETTCYRDLLQIKGKGFDGDLALEILSTIAKNQEPTTAEIARKIRRDARVIQRYLDAFCAIFVLIKLSPHQAGIGKPHYLLCDCGLAHYLGSDPNIVLRTHLLTEALAKFEYAGLGRPLIKYYRNQKTSRIPLVFEFIGTKMPTLAIGFFDGETPGRAELSSLEAFAARCDKNKNMRFLLLTQTRFSYFEKRKNAEIEVHPLCG
jgi:predicted AAA+ superfamily ATPase